MLGQRFAGLFLIAAAACGDSSTGSPDAARDAPAVDAVEVDAPPVDAPGDAPGFPATCEGACRMTRLTAKFGSTMRQLDRAYYGVTGSGANATLHVEAYRGGAAGCPTESSPTPDYTMILGTVPVPTSTDELSSPGNLLDFSGDLLGGSIGASATAVKLTPVAANVCTDCPGMPAPSDPDGMVALDVRLTFANGTITGHLYATHCDSLDL
ncbi:MAG: hypothetical protein ACTHU0_32200 [Kofleriaceae bacterium]